MSYFYSAASYAVLNAGMQERAARLFKKGLRYRLNAREPVLSIYLRRSRYAFVHSQLDTLNLDETYRAYLRSIVLKHEKRYEDAWETIRDIDHDALLPLKVRILYDMKQLDTLIGLSGKGIDVLGHLNLHQKETLLAYMFRAHHFNEAESMIEHTQQHQMRLRTLFDNESSRAIAKYRWQPFRKKYLGMAEDPGPDALPSLLPVIESLDMPLQDTAHVLLVNRFYDKPDYRSALNRTSVSYLNEKPELLQYISLEALHTLDFSTPQTDSATSQLDSLLEHYHSGSAGGKTLEAIHDLLPQVKLTQNHIRSLRRLILDGVLNLQDDRVIQLFNSDKRAYTVFQDSSMFLERAVSRQVDDFVYSNFSSRIREKIFDQLVNTLVQSDEKIRLPKHFLHYLKKNRHKKRFNMYMLVRHTYRQGDITQGEKYIHELDLEDQFKLRLYLAKFQFGFNELEEALAQVKAAQRIKDRDPDLYRHFIRIHHYRGDITDRLEYIRKMKKEFPDRLIDREDEMAEDEYTLLREEWRLDVDAPPLEGADPDKILFVLNKAYPIINGYTVRSDEMIQSVKEHGYHPVIATRLGWSPEHEGYETPAQYDEGIDAYYIDRSDEYLTYRTPLRTYFEQYAREIVDIVEKERPHAIYAASNFQNAYAALSVGRQMGIPTLYEVRGLWQYTQSTKNPHFYQSERFYMHEKYELKCCELADKVTCISESLKDFLVGKGIDASKITVLPNGVNTDEIAPVQRDEALVQKYNLEDKIVVGFLGSITDYEGLNLMLEAVHSINADRRHKREFVCMIVGKGPARDDVINKARSLDMMDQAIFPGKIPREEVQNYYSIMDITPFPRKNEPLCQLVTPLKPYEAMAMGRRVIVSDVAALNEMVSDGVNGRVFKAEDVDALINAMLETIEDDALGHQAREWVTANRDWNVVVKDLFELLPLASKPIDRKEESEETG
ncbi:glycosyltransferase family 4 protein [Salinicoccus roseus]|uniref:glycosyltransferase family 4 protein n=1 Tax=Salinicoccus roseus TaxID=45670 RepID=UPI002300D46F|nr:glycosyltransferase family 4 protein [Salinicoccus roseus]